MGNAQLPSESTVGFDLSKFACATGAKQAKRDGKDGLLYATASVFELPIEDGCADAVTNIFAPCAEEEYKRILKRGGYLFVVGAGKEHLMGLKKAIYDDVYENGERADRFLREVNSAAVYVNASTRFTDGGEFGFGAEIGISTQKLHARGPMGLDALTTKKYLIKGEGQVR